MEQVIQERFIEGPEPARIAAWVQYQPPAPQSFTATTDLAESPLSPPPSDQQLPTPRARLGTTIPEQACASLPPTQQMGAQTAGEGCWRCGQPGYSVGSAL